MIPIFLDYFIREEYFETANKVLINGKAQGVNFCISYLTIANFAYILRKQPRKILYSLLKDSIELFEIIEADQSQISQAIEIHSSDFEDALQYMNALHGNCDCIITRNQKDFSYSRIPILSPEAYLREYL